MSYDSGPTYCEVDDYNTQDLLREIKELLQKLLEEIKTKS